MAEPEQARSHGTDPGWRLIVAVELGILLNPLNSSMIAVAMVPLEGDFHVGVSVASWLISGFYLAAAVGTPLMGRLADQFGPKRIFLVGLAVVGVSGVLAPLAPGFGWLVASMRGSPSPSAPEEWPPGSTGSSRKDG